MPSLRPACSAEPRSAGSEPASRGLGLRLPISLRPRRARDGASRSATDLPTRSLVRIQSPQGPREKDPPAAPAGPKGSGRGDWIRTSDLLNPIQVRYQSALRPGEGRPRRAYPGIANARVRRPEPAPGYDRPASHGPFTPRGPPTPRRADSQTPCRSSPAPTAAPKTTSPQGNSPFFCKACHAIVDRTGIAATGAHRRTPPPPVSPRKPFGEPVASPPAHTGTGRTGSINYHVPSGPGAGFSVGGSRVVGFALAALAAIVAGGGLAWFGAYVLRVPLLFAFLAAWAIRRALATGSGGGTPDRGVIGGVFLFVLAAGTCVAARYGEYSAIAERESRHYGEIYGPSAGRHAPATGDRRRGASRARRRR